ncbi:hypothetical protein As57867_004274, partial [Aphanomyces stellatus]
MPKLFCVVVGHEGSPFSVNIAADETVDDLKDKIKEKNMYQFPAKELELYHILKGYTEVDEDVLRELKQQGSNDLTVKYVNDIAWMKATKLLKRYLDANPPVEEQIHVLVVVPEGAVAARTSHAQAVEFQDAVLREMRRQMQIQTEVLIAILPHKSDKSYTDGALGQLECARLEQDELIIDFAPIHNAEPFWSPTIQQQADAITNEADFDAFITPFFNMVLANCGM